jgi:hypothetical protein
MRLPILFAACASLLPASAIACQPLPPSAFAESPARVQANFQGARFVVLARLADVRDVSISTGEPAFTVKVERASFRVQRAFKGGLKPGDTFHVDSGVTSCGRGVRDDGWVPFIANGKARTRAAVPARWLVYYTPLPTTSAAQPPLFEIDGSPLARPAQWAAYDLALLGTHAKRWSVRP